MIIGLCNHYILFCPAGLYINWTLSKQRDSSSVFKGDAFSKTFQSPYSKGCIFKHFSVAVVNDHTQLN